MSRPRGSPAELEQRRLRAIELLMKGLQPHTVAERLGVGLRSVRRWNQAYRSKGQARSDAQPGQAHASQRPQVA